MFHEELLKIYHSLNLQDQPEIEQLLLTALNIYHDEITSLVQLGYATTPAFEFINAFKSCCLSISKISHTVQDASFLTELNAIQKIIENILFETTSDLSEQNVNLQAA